MEYIKSIILGIVQGLTEFLPVSSSGHLAIFKEILGSNAAEPSVLLDVMLHLGTLVAVFIAFRTTIKGLIKDFFGMLPAVFTGKFKYKSATKYQKMIVMIIVSCIPLLIIYPFMDKIELLFSSIRFVGIALLLTALLMIIADRCVKGKKNSDTSKIKDGLFVGISQAIAIVPGLSRSGTTITAGLLCGFDRAFAAEFSFIMSIPAIIAANIVTFAKELSEGMDFSLLLPYFVGAVIAGFVGFLAIKLVTLVVKKDKFGLFAIYCAVVGLCTVIYSFIK